MNHNDEIVFFIFWKSNSTAFKQVMMDSKTIDSRVVTGETVTAKILNENNVIMTKCWRNQNNKLIMKILDLILIIIVGNYSFINVRTFLASLKYPLLSFHLIYFYQE